jgi:hypothetical protein
MAARRCETLRGVKAGISFAPALSKCCFEQPLPFGSASALPSRRTKPAREIRQAAVSSFLESPEFGRSDRALDLDPRHRAADQLSNIVASRMITFTFRDHLIALRRKRLKQRSIRLTQHYARLKRDNWQASTTAVVAARRR